MLNESNGSHPTVRKTSSAADHVAMLNFCQLIYKTVNRGMYPAKSSQHVAISAGTCGDGHHEHLHRGQKLDSIPTSFVWCAQR